MSHQEYQRQIKIFCVSFHCLFLLLKIRFLLPDNKLIAVNALAHIPGALAIVFTLLLFIVLNCVTLFDYFGFCMAIVITCH